MSSAADSLNNQAETAEPNTKRAKIDNNEQSKLDNDRNNVAADNNNGATEKVVTESNNGTSKQVEASSSGLETNDIPTKVSANGSGDKAGTTENGADAGEELEQGVDPQMAKRLSEVESIQTLLGKLNEQASEEILKVEQKFNELRRPWFERRNAILKEITNFWVTTLANHPVIAQLIEHREDEDCLNYLTNLDVEELEDIKSGYNLKFYFAENPYIKNDLIVREVRHLSSEEVITGTTVLEFKNNPQGRKLQEIVENCISQERRKVRPEEMQSSFFAWLSQQQSEPGTDEIAEIIKDQIWPSPLEFYFTDPEDFDTDDDDDDSDDDGEDYDDGIENEMPEMGDEEELEGGEFEDGDDDDDEDDDDDDIDDEEGEDEE